MRIVRASGRYAASYCKSMDTVAREGKFLSVSKGYPLSDMKLFIKICRERGYPEFFLINENNEAVGWCDIVSRTNDPYDLGYLGIGILREYRGQGWGKLLISTAVHDALSRQFNEIRLEVRVSNENAIHVYKSCGFEFIERIKNGVTTDGVSEDVLLMRYKPAYIPQKSFVKKIKYQIKAVLDI